MRSPDDDLDRAIEETRGALDEIDRALCAERPATISMLARALRAVLAGQAAILARLAGRPPGPRPKRSSRAAPEPEKGAIRPIAPDLIVDDGTEDLAGARAADERPALGAPAAPAEAPAASAPAASCAEIPAAPKHLQRAATDVFAVAEINRWLASGTIFQIRGGLAFLNLRSMGGQKADEFRGHIRRMGFSEELGRLTVEGIEGDVMLFRKPD
jgi:hypothetical protein